MNKKVIFILIPVILLIAGIILLLLPRSENTRSITVISVSGDEAYITRESDRQFLIREGTRLSAGSIINTGGTTTIDVMTGDGSHIRINESTEINISELSGNALMLTVVTGSISEIIAESPEDDSTINSGNITMGLRGASLTENNDENDMSIVVQADTSNADNSYTWFGRLLAYLRGHRAEEGSRTIE